MYSQINFLSRQFEIATIWLREYTEIRFEIPIWKYLLAKCTTIRSKYLVSFASCGVSIWQFDIDTHEPIFSTSFELVCETKFET